MIHYQTDALLSSQCHFLFFQAPTAMFELARSVCLRQMQSNHAYAWLQRGENEDNRHPPEVNPYQENRGQHQCPRSTGNAPCPFMYHIIKTIHQIKSVSTDGEGNGRKNTGVKMQITNNVSKEICERKIEMLLTLEMTWRGS